MPILILVTPNSFNRFKTGIVTLSGCNSIPIPSLIIILVDHINDLAKIIKG